MMRKAVLRPSATDADSESTCMQDVPSNDDTGSTGSTGDIRIPCTQEGGLDAKALAAQYAGPDTVPGDGATTLMIRNLPRSYTEEDLISDIEAVAGPDVFDFLYMPWDARRGSNISYAFVNFMNQKATECVFYGLSGRHWRLVRASKCCRIAAAHVQGLPANLLHYADIANVSDAQRHCPIVMLNGRRANYDDALQMFCTPDVISEVRTAAAHAAGEHPALHAEVPSNNLLEFSVCSANGKEQGQLAQSGQSFSNMGLSQQAPVLSPARGSGRLGRTLSASTAQSLEAHAPPSIWDASGAAAGLDEFALQGYRRMFQQQHEQLRNAAATGRSPCDMRNGVGAPPGNNALRFGAADVCNSQAFHSTCSGYLKDSEDQLDYSLEQLKQMQVSKEQAQPPLPLQRTSPSKGHGPRSEQISELQKLMHKAENLRVNPSGRNQHRMELVFAEKQDMGQADGQHQFADGLHNLFAALQNKQSAQHTVQHSTMQSQDSMHLKDKYDSHTWLQQRLDIIEQAGHLGDARALGLHDFLSSRLV